MELHIKFAARAVNEARDKQVHLLSPAPTFPSTRQVVSRLDVLDEVFNGAPRKRGR